MNPDLSQLDSFLQSSGLDGYLLDASATTADQRYLSGFGGHDPFVTLYSNSEVHLLVRGLDRGLARKESRADSVSGPSDYGYREKVKAYGSTAARYRVLSAFIDEHEVTSVAVPERFPVATADALREFGVRVVPDTDGIVTSIRAVKTIEEIEHIRHTQSATERAMERAEELLRASEIANGVLTHKTAQLTSERVKEQIELILVHNGCSLDDTIVACGTHASNPHDRGSGPLRPNVPIVIDIFPQNKRTKYHADMTRTFVVGAPSEEAKTWYDLTRVAQQAAFDVIGPGVTGAAVHDAVCSVYENAGTPTMRIDESTETGFIHGTGHGVGLDVHEFPLLNTEGGELKPGHVVTIEPGVYDPTVGGIRIEDLVVITESGYENLTQYHKTFVI